jgi:hypothetical protein
MEECNCKEKIILNEGDGSFVARETLCPKHGYYTSCWRCNEEALTTEICNYHFFNTELCKKHTYE